MQTYSAHGRVGARARRRRACPEYLILGSIVSLICACTNPVDPELLPGGTGGSDQATTGAPSAPSGDSSSPDPKGPGTSDPSEKGPEPKCTTGAVRECTQTPEGSDIDYPDGIPQGSCKAGTQSCLNGTWGPCIGAIAPAAQDSCEPGNDDNCNGRPTDHCACTAGETTPCGSEVGACEQGVMTCGDNGRWGECEGDIKPSTELCDGKNIDEDCDGAADSADPKCECIAGQLESCKLPGRGDCSLGVRTCREQGSFGGCKPRFEQSLEACGARSDEHELTLGPATGDEDCDGEVDETDRGNPTPQGCTIYMVDKDEDGYGAQGPNIATDKLNATWGCMCAGKIPAGWVRAREGRHNRDCGDCKENGYFVSPDQPLGPSTQPSECLLELGYEPAFDYNCDGVATPELVGKFACIKVGPGKCKSEGFWHGADSPACGVASPRYSESDCVFHEPTDSCLIIARFPPDHTQACE